MKKTMTLFILFALLFNTALATCKAPAPQSLGTHLDRNEAYLQSLLNYEHCLKNQFQKTFTPQFQKKLKDQKVLLSVIQDKIKDIQHQEQDIIKGKWSYRVLLTTEQEKVIEKDRLQLEKDKVKMAQAYGL